ncbi:cuticle collagen 13-like [Patiria miniata]|uniref:Uncharacterized protein n=1 Tax=Patiria miniata TaxID=46514 RepID=A0A914B6E1_PATMI|nr:cuticle collagen 13-like [Patiria miniata]
MALMWLVVRIVFVFVCFSPAFGEYCPGTYSNFWCPTYSDNDGQDECCQDNTPYNHCCYFDTDYESVYQLSVGAIVGIVIGSLILLGIIIAVIVAVCCCCCCATKSGAQGRRTGPTTVTHFQGGTQMTTMTAQSYSQGQPAYPGGQQVPTGQPPYPGQQAYPGQPQAYPGQPQAYPGQPQAYPGQPQGYPGQPMAYPGQPQAYPPPAGQYPGAQAASQYYPSTSAPAGQCPQPNVPGVIAGTGPSDPPPQYENSKET